MTVTCHESTSTLPSSVQVSLAHLITHDPWDFQRSCGMGRFTEEEESGFSGTIGELRIGYVCRRGEQCVVIERANHAVFALTTRTDGFICEVPNHFTYEVHGGITYETIYGPSHSLNIRVTFSHERVRLRHIAPFTLEVDNTQPNPILDVCPSEDGSGSYTVHDRDAGTSQIIGQDEVDRRFGPECCLHSSFDTSVFDTLRSYVLWES